MCSFIKPWNCVRCLLYYSYLSQQPQLPSVANTWHKFTWGLGGLHPCWVCWWLNLYFSKAGKKNVVCFSWKVQNPQRPPRPWPRLISPAQRARRAGVQFFSPPAPTLWASPFPAHIMPSLDVTGWVFKVAAPLQQVLALLFCFLTLGLQVWICWISSKDISCF